MDPALENLKTPQTFAPAEAAVLPVARDLQSEYVSLIGTCVTAHMPRPGHSTYSVTGELTAVFKGANNDLILRIDTASHVHMIAHSKISDLNFPK